MWLEGAGSLVRCHHVIIWSASAGVLFAPVLTLVRPVDLRVRDRPACEHVARGAGVVVTFDRVDHPHPRSGRVSGPLYSFAHRGRVAGPVNDPGKGDTGAGW